MSNDAALTPAQNFKNLLVQYRSELKGLMPADISEARLLQTCLTVVKNDPVLIQCDGLSLIKCVQDAFRLNLDPGGALGLCYFIAYGKQAQFQLGYQGICELMYRTGRIGGIVAKEVYEGDIFHYSYGSDQKLRHVPDMGRDEKKVEHFYCYATLDCKHFTFDVMTREEVERIQARARSKSGPWKTDWVEMGKKTVLKRYSKTLPKSVEAHRMIQEDNVKEFGQPEVPKVDVGDGEPDWANVKATVVEGAHGDN